jgi:hypothetical protein
MCFFVTKKHDKKAAAAAQHSSTAAQQAAAGGRATSKVDSGVTDGVTNRPPHRCPPSNDGELIVGNRAT